MDSISESRFPRSIVLKTARRTLWSVFLIFLNLAAAAPVCQAVEDQRPNILIAISDDVSWPHASAYGSQMVRTPAFDQIAREGVLFHNAFCPSPGCSPSRAAFLTGRHTWMIEEAGTHASYFGKKYITFPERLSAVGYHVGSTGKGWGPGNFRQAGRTENPAGKVYGRHRQKTKNFADFLDERKDDQPFCFWFGSSDAHRGYDQGSGERSGKRQEEAEVPPFLPDVPEIRSDLLDYAFEVDRFDQDCAELIRTLKEAGLYENTLIIITSDNGMPFPRAKANCYEYGLHMPLAVSWPDMIPSGKEFEGLVNFYDLTATILEAAGLADPDTMAQLRPAVVGRSLLAELKAGEPGLGRQATFAGRERHSSSRYRTLGYPQRALRTKDHLLIWNCRPERAPAGAPQKYGKALFSASGELQEATPGPPHGGYHDIDNGPTLQAMIRLRDDPTWGELVQESWKQRPEWELYAIEKDPGCLQNLARETADSDLLKKLQQQLRDELVRTGDPRVLGKGDIWETYPRISGLRWFPVPEWAEQKPDSIPAMPWLEERKPRIK